MKQHLKHVELLDEQIQELDKLAAVSMREHEAAIARLVAESAGDNRSSRCPKGNAYLRRVLCQSAQAAVRTKNGFFQQKFQRLLPRLGYQKAPWAIARRLSNAGYTVELNKPNLEAVLG